jgi:TRAP-type uncharacterized transport system substrate-binding protein
VSDQESKDTVFAITRALFSSSNRNLLVQGPPAARAIVLSRATQNLSAPLHVGAAKFYQDVKRHNAP